VQNSNLSLSILVCISVYPATMLPRYSPDNIDILLSVKQRSFTNAREKIFGILSLVKEWSGWERIDADYSKLTQ
jgi:hypothetical protein